ncbi:hypothetical protein ACFTZ8_26825 [Streptomyces fungicidicus]|uniref:hypothetical protein n=1 Tax=Streptomyces fungicidicus TaxID=68203 RepID=UPI003645A518
MRRRLAALLLTLAAVLGLALSTPTPAAAIDGPNPVDIGCRVGSSSLLDLLPGSPGGGSGKITGADVCEKIGDAAEKSMKEPWKALWESILGDIVKSAADVVRWIIKKVLTVALLGPSLDLEATGLFGQDATLAGMLTWLGLVIAAAGAMWQMGRMAVTGQSKHLGRAALGWVENTILSAVGVAMIALLLAAGDALTTGLVDATFADDGKAYETIVAALVPAAISNPITMLCVIAVLLLVGFIQLIMVFLRQSAIPILCLLLPVAGGGRAGGDATRQWAPKLITSICVVIAYKPILAVIICTGFAEFGQAKTLAEWLRGCATLVLAILAPGPLTKLFAPFGAAVGAGMSAGGASGALSAAAGYVAGKNKDSGGDSGGGVAPTDAVTHAQYVAQQMGRQDQGGGDGGAGQDGGQGGDAQAQAARNEASRVPGQAGAEGPAGADAATAGTSSATATGTAAAGAGTAAAGAVGIGVGIQVLDGVNDAIQGASGQVGGGNQQ